MQQGPINYFELFRTALREGGPEKVMELLRDFDDEITEKALFWAAANGDAKELKRLLPANEELVDRLPNPIDVDELLDLLPDSVDELPNNVSAALNSHQEVVKLLLADRRVNPAANNNIRLAASIGHHKVVK